MTRADFTLTVEFDDEPDRSVRVVVYDTVKGLRIAAARYDNATLSRRRRRHDAYADTLGICHRFEWVSIDGGVPDPLCAIVRLAEPNLGIGVVTHELAHAAVWIQELREPDTPLVTENDETFCLILGDLVRQTVNALYERGVYED